jgi:hypothetical protein
MLYQPFERGGANPSQVYDKSINVTFHTGWSAQQQAEQGVGQGLQQVDNASWRWHALHAAAARSRKSRHERAGEVVIYNISKQNHGFNNSLLVVDIAAIYLSSCLHMC